MFLHDSRYFVHRIYALRGENTVERGSNVENVDKALSAVRRVVACCMAETRVTIRILIA